MCDTFLYGQFGEKMLTALTAGIPAVSFYLGALVLQAITVINKKDRNSKVFLFGALAVLFHGFNVYGVIRASDGYRFGFFEISTLIAFSISSLVLISSVRKPLENLFLCLFPLAILAIIASLFSKSTTPATELNIGLATHILLSILAYSFITIAALQATFLAFQNHQLKNHITGGVISKFPPLQDMEGFLFELLWVGQILLSVGILAGFFFFEDIWGRDGVIHKTFFSILAWMVFSVLLWGRHRIGWRGTSAIRWTLIGFTFLITGFYGSKFVLEFILS